MIKFLTFILCVITLCVKADNAFEGAEFEGFNNDNELPRKLGVFGWWDAGYGIQTTAVNRVQTWADLSGNNFIMCNYSNAALTGFNAQPLFTRTPATNSFPAIDNTLPTGTSQPRPLRVFGAFPQAFQGINKPFTFITLCAPITNSAGPFSWVFQNPAGTNQLSSIQLGYQPFQGASTARLLWGGDTNRVTVTATSLAGFQSLSNYTYVTFTYDGVNMRTFVNLNASASGAPATQGQMTPTLFQISGSVRTNFSGTDVNGQDYKTVFMAWTNDIGGTSVSNVINFYNNNRYKVF